MAATIYLDNSATTCVRQEVVKAMLPYLGEKWGNPSSIHALGRQSSQAISSARQQVANLLNCHPEEVYFTPCGTYSNNVALLGRARVAEANGQGKHLITSPIEHPSVLGPAKFLEAQGWEISCLPVDRQGFVRAHDLQKAIRADTSIISIMWANNEVGTIQPLAELARIAHEAGVYFHTDAVQVAGKMPIDVSQVPVSALSISGHKFYAPKGIGILFVRKPISLMPLVFGGGQEQALFPGTESLANIVAIGVAAQLAQAELKANLSLLCSVQQLMTKKLLEIEGVRLTGPVDLQKRIPGHISVLVEGGQGEALVMKADLQGVCISSGSACHQGIIGPSQVLLALGFSCDEALGSVRITAGRYNSYAECEKASAILVDVFSSVKQSATSVPLR